MKDINSSDDEEFLDEFEVSKTEIQRRRSAFLIVVDCNDSFYNSKLTNYGSETYKDYNARILIFEFIYQFLSSLANVSPNDCVSIILSGVSKNCNKGLFPHIYQLNQLEPPSLGLLNYTLNLKDKTLAEIESEFGKLTGEYDFSHLLWTCMTTLNEKKYLFTSKHIYFLSAECIFNIPNVPSKLIISKLRDLLSHQILITVIPVMTNINPSEIRLNKLLDNNITHDPINDLKSCKLISHIHIKNARSVSVIPFFLDHNQNLDPILVNLSQATVPTQIENSKLLYYKDNREVNRNYKYIDHSNSEISNSDIRCKLKNGHTNLHFLQSDIDKIKTLVVPQKIYDLKSGFIQIKGFLKSNSIPNLPSLTVGNSFFLSCSDQNSTENIAKFKALMESCLRNQVCIICEYAARYKSKIRSAILLVNEYEDNTNYFTQYTGAKNVFLLRNLPFYNEFRPNVLRDSGIDIEFDDDLLNCFDRTIKCSTDKDFKYISNPDIDKMRDIIETLALKRESVSNLKDKTVFIYDDDLNTQDCDYINERAN